MASEVGSGQVAIFPVFKGFRSKVNTEVETSGRSGGRAFERAFSSSSKNLGAASLKALQGSVASASKNLSRARLTEQDAVGKVKVAEAALTEARTRGVAGSARVVAAEERLASAQRRVADAQTKTKTASDALSKAQKSLADSTEAAGDSSTKAAGKYAKGWDGLKGRISDTLTSAVTAATVAAEGAAASGGAKTGRTFGSKLGEGIKSATSTALKAVTGIVAGAAALFTGMAGTLGFKRLVTLDTARIKLKALGNDAKTVTEIMKNAGDSVDGTAFGLGDAATVAAASVAAGIKPGQDLTKTLKLVADGAAVAETDMGSMGSMFNKVAASGKLQGDVLNQLSDAGLPILRDLSKVLGVSQEEVYKLSAAGKIGFADFQKAMELGVGGAAATMGTSFTGALGNIKAAIGRIGANFLDGQGTGGGFFSQLKPLMVEALAGLKSLEPGAKVVGEAFGKAFTSGVAHVRELIGGIRAMVAAFRDGGSDVTSSGFAGVLERIGLVARVVFDEVSGSVRALVAAFVAGGDDVTSSGMAGVFERIGLAARAVVDFLAPIGESIGSLFSGMDLGQLSGIAGVIAAVMIAVKGPMSLILGLATKFGPQLLKMGSLFRFLTGPLGLLAGLFITAYSTSEPFRETINGLIGTVGTLVGQLLGGLVPVLTSLATALLPVVEQIFAALVPVFSQIVMAVVPLVTQLIGFLVPVLLQLVSAVLPVLGQVLGFVGPLFAVVAQIVGGLVTQLVAFLVPAIQALLPVVQVIFGIISNVITTAMGIISGIITTVTGILSGDWAMAWQGIKDTLGAVLDGIFSHVSQVFGDLPGAILGALGDLGGLLLESGQALIQGFFDGIGNMAGKVGEVVGGFVQGVRDFFPFSPAKKGPFSGSGYTTHSGKAMAGDFADAMAGQKGTVKAAASTLMGAAALTGGTVAAGAAGASGGATGADARGLPPINIYPSEGMDEEAFAQKVRRIIEELFGRG